MSLCPGSESNNPIILQVIRTRATRQNIKQLVPYIIIAGRLTTDPEIQGWKRDDPKLSIDILYVHQGKPNY